MFYVIEIQTDNVGAAISYSFVDRNQAEAKYHDLLRIAALSQVPKHGALLFNDDGFVLKSEVYNHIPEPEPESSI